MDKVAVARYQRVSDASAPPRDIEVTAFGLVNRLLAEDQGERRRLKALGKNHELWSLLVKDLARSGNALPAVLKQQLVALGVWSMQYRYWWRIQSPGQAASFSAAKRERRVLAVGVALCQSAILIRLTAAAVMTC